MKRYARTPAACRPNLPRLHGCRLPRPAPAWLLLGMVLVAACGGAESTQEVDSDGDGLSDAREQTIGTSPLLADTDGDGLSDEAEVLSGGFNPLVADLPKISIQVVDQPSIELNVASRETGESLASYSASYAQGESSSYSRSDTTATSIAVEASTRVYAETSVSATPVSIGGSAKAGVESSVSTSATQETSTSINQTSARDSRQEFARYREDTSGFTNVVENGRLTTTLSITNISDVSFELARVEVIARKRADDGSGFQPVATLRFEPAGGPQELGTQASIEKLVTTTTPSVPLLKALMANPSGLLFTVSNYELNRVGQENGRSFARLSQDISAQTAQVVIDYGGRPVPGVDTVEQYMVATNVRRDPVTSMPLGITVGEALASVLGIGYEVQDIDVLDAQNEPTGDTRSVLFSVRGRQSQGLRDGFWYVFSSSDSLDDPTIDFDDVILKPRDRITLIYMADADLDQLFDREEFVLGTDPQSADTDMDGITDFDEVRVGWDVMVDGNTTRVFSDPLNPDVDEDGANDAEERDRNTDPNAADFPPIAEWAATYDTVTEFGYSYTPLVLEPGGTMTVRGEPIEYTYDAEENRVRWSSQTIAGNVTTANFTFTLRDDRKYLSGSIQPRAQDGPVDYNGRER